MSDLVNQAALERTLSTQLPVGWYVEQSVHDLEMELLFATAPMYVGHELMVPNVGDYRSLEWLGHGQMLRRTAQGVSLMSNVCRHRQAIMLKGSGNTDHIVCPLHRWTYTADGELLGAPHFKDKPCLHLGREQLHNWNGLLFQGGEHNVIEALSRMGVASELDFSGYMLDKVTVEEYNFNWKTFIEVYLEDYHVVPFHPGLGGFVSCEDLSWEFGDWWSVQTVGVNHALQRPGSRVYDAWHKSVLEYQGGTPPKHGAIWLTLYPNVMVEWYANTLVVSRVIPRGPLACTNVVEFYYPEDIVLFEREYIASEQAAYQETAREDEDICQRMDDGRRALHARGRNEVGPYQSPMEDGMLHFHEYYRRQMEQALNARTAG